MENKLVSPFSRLKNLMPSFGFLRRLRSHDVVSDKIERAEDNAKFKNQKELIAPPEPTPETKTSFGEYFHVKGAVKIDNFFASLSSYFKTDVNDINHKQAIERYRAISMLPEVSDALDEYVHSIVVHNDENPDVVKIDFKDSNLFTKALRERIGDEFRYLLNLLDFNNTGERLVTQLLIDGCLPLEKVFDENYIGRGVIDLNILDSMYMTRTIIFNTDPYTKLKKLVDEYFVFTYPTLDKIRYGLTDAPYSTYQINAGYKLQIPKFLVTYVDSGKYHPTRAYPVSILHKALKVANQLKLLEDSLLIYRITRAPERRVFYIDVGNLPPTKAEEHVEDLMRQYRTEKSYNPETGGLNADADIMAMIEDFWLPRRNGQASTEVSTLSGAQNLGEITDLDYFYKKLWRALGVPYSRRISKDSGGIAHSHTADITADELAFYKTVRFIRRRIENGIFKDLLRTHLVAKNIVSGDNIEDVLANVKFIWNEDNNFSELIKFEVMQARFDIISNMGLNVADFVSKPWVAKNILKQTDEEIIQLAKERKNPGAYGFTDESKEGAEAAPGAGGGGGFGGGGFGGGAPVGGGISTPPMGGEEEFPVGGEEEAFPVGGEVGGVGVEATPGGETAPTEVGIAPGAEETAPTTEEEEEVIPTSF